MQEILHIFSKDVRRLAAPLALLIALQATFVVSEWRLYSVHPWSDSGSLLNVILPFTWIFLIAALVLQEKLPGTRQYWLTRPISWYKLLAAKLLFAFVFVNLLLFVSDCVILSSLHLPIVPVDLWLRQIPFTTQLFLPAFCLAALSDGLGQFAMGLVVAAFGFVIVTLLPALIWRSPHGGEVVSLDVARFSPDWLFLLLPVLVLFITTLQFAYRTTALSRILFLALILWLIPLTFWANLSRGFLSRTQPEKLAPGNELPQLRVVPDLDSGRHPDPVSPDGFAHLFLPVQMQGLPADTYLEGNGIYQRRQVSLFKDQSGYWLRFDLEKPPNEITEANAKIYLYVFHEGKAQTIRLGSKAIFSPAESIHCQSAWSSGLFNCWAGPQRDRREYRAFAKFDNAIIELNDAHFSGIFEGGLISGLSPITSWKLSINVKPQYALTPDIPVRFVSVERSGTLERNFEVHNRDLSSYIVRP